MLIGCRRGHGQGMWRPHYMGVLMALAGGGANSSCAEARKGEGLERDSVAEVDASPDAGDEVAADARDGAADAGDEVDAGDRDGELDTKAETDVPRERGDAVL